MSIRFQYGDLLDIVDVDLICHQVNCLTVKSHGLSAQIAKQYPWANVYQSRISMNGRNLATTNTRGTPGKVKMFNKTNYPSVACLHAQWDYGCTNRLRKRNIPPYNDTTENRESWFQQCLDELGFLRYQTIAFPHKIGCGLAGGNWSNYLSMIKIFAYQYDKKIIIVVPRKTCTDMSRGNFRDAIR